MNPHTALYLLGLKDQVAPTQLKAAFENKRLQIEQRLSEAPTEALRSKYRQELAELQQAYNLASGTGREAVPGLSATMVRDLPGAKPFYTQEGGVHESAAGARLMLAEGQVLAGRYEVRRKLGAGGMGAVFAALDRNRDEEIAIKVLLPGLLKDTQARQRFLEEAKLSADLSHPNIVNVYDVQKDGDWHFITMELLEGRTLRQEMETRKSLKKPFTVQETKLLAQHLGLALAYAHQRTVHRDVKPENIWLTPEDQVKLMDFGIARLLSTSQLTTTGTSMGTAYYMAPEQLKGAKQVDGRADQYALAAVLFEMLTGEVPAGAVRRPHEIRKDVPTALSEAVMKALSPKPEDRYSEMEGFAKAISRSKGRSGEGKKHPVALAVAAVLALACAATVTFPKWKQPALLQWRSWMRDDQLVAQVQKAREQVVLDQKQWEQMAAAGNLSAPPELSEAHDLIQQGNDQFSQMQDQQALAAYQQSDQLYQQALADGQKQIAAIADEKKKAAEALTQKQQEEQAQLQQQALEAQGR